MGYGIDVNVTANFTSDGTYAHDDKGRGFEWRDIAYEVTAEEGEEVTFATGGTASATHMWFSVCNASLLAVHTDALDAEIAKADFAAVIAAAQATVDAKAGVGEGLFLIPAAAFDTYATAVAAAKAIYDNADATLEEVKTAIETLAAATEAYTASQTLPNEKTLYQFKLNVEGDVYMNLSDAGVKIQDTPSAISFVPAEKAGTYYLKSGSYYVGLAGGNAWTMSTSADKKAAWTFTAVGEGLYNINNIVTAGRFVGTNSAEIAAGSSVYADKKTDNGNIKWAISEIEMAVTMINPAVETADKIAEGDSIEFTTNIDDFVGCMMVKVLEVNDDSGESEYLASYRSAVKSEGHWNVELFSTMKFRQGYTY